MNKPSSMSRRRAICIVAGCLAALLPGSGQAASMREWRGTALGANARIVLDHRDRSHMERTLDAVLQEIERLENIFSLYRPHSAVARLNRDGILHTAPLELVELTRYARRISAATLGAFDITVQPLWQLYRTHFQRFPGDTNGPPADAVRVLLRHIGNRLVHIDGASIHLAPGTQVTFNGIAQGYITDRIAMLLKARGWHNVLIDIGETRALGTHPDGRYWKIGLPGGKETSIAGMAIATSDGAGTRFVPFANHHHLFDPHTGQSAETRLPVTIVARNATTADALSTALFVAPTETHKAIFKRFPDAYRVII